MIEIAGGEEGLGKAARLLDKGEELRTTDPSAALPVLREALEALRQIGILCLETRAAAGIGWVLAQLGRLDEAEEAFEEPRQRSCPCCRPFVDRLYADLLEKKGCAHCIQIGGSPGDG